VDRFVAKLNIEHFCKKLATETDEDKRRILTTLLAEEKAKLVALEADPPGEDRQEQG